MPSTLVVKPIESQCALYLEGWSDDVIARATRELSSNRLRATLIHIATRTAELVDRPADVTLVVVEDYAAGAIWRSRQYENGVMDRADRVFTTPAVACTFGPSEGESTCVIFNGRLLAPLVTGSCAWAEIDQLALDHTVVHEAQHVIQFQRGRWGGTEDDMCGDDDFLALIEDVAATMCDEYAAMWHEVRITDRIADQEKDVACTLEELDADLELSTRNYYTTNDFDDLCEQILNAARKMWLMLAYWAAVYEGWDNTDGDDLAGHGLWARYVGPTSYQIFSILQTIPAVELMIDPTDFDDIVRQLISVLRDSLDRIGRHVVRQAAELGAPVTLQIDAGTTNRR